MPDPSKGLVPAILSALVIGAIFPIAAIADDQKKPPDKAPPHANPCSSGFTFDPATAECSPAPHTKVASCPGNTGRRITCAYATCIGGVPYEGCSQPNKEVITCPVAPPKLSCQVLKK